jgi:hypothetical protein
MIATMLFMIKICINIRNKHQIIKQKDRIFTGTNFNIINILHYLYYNKLIVIKFLCIFSSH